jgi:hypothetical protein
MKLLSYLAFEASEHQSEGSVVGPQPSHYLRNGSEGAVGRAGSGAHDEGVQCQVPTGQSRRHSQRTDFPLPVLHGRASLAEVQMTPSVTDRLGAISAKLSAVPMLPPPPRPRPSQLSAPPRRQGQLEMPYFQRRSRRNIRTSRRERRGCIPASIKTTPTRRPMLTAV